MQTERKGFRPAIIGLGNVGQALADLQIREGLEPLFYSPPEGYNNRDVVNDLCDVGFIAVPSPGEPNSGALDISIVRESVEWLEVPLIVILSTLNVGDTDRLIRDTGKAIVYVPEWGPGETPGHPYRDLGNREFIVIGGQSWQVTEAQAAYQKFYPSTVRYHLVSAAEAELIKLMENSFLALKAEFFNEWAHICDLHGAAYHRIREALADDPRIGPSHTLRMKSWAATSKCLSKDVPAAAHSGLGHARLVEALVRIGNSQCPCLDLRKR